MRTKLKTRKLNFLAVTILFIAIFVCISGVSAAKDNNFIEQTDTIKDNTDYIDSCGPIALQELLKTQGKNVTTTKIAEQAETDETGTSMQGMINAADKNDVKLYGVKKEASQLQKGDIILINTEESNHYLLVKNITRKNITLIDPSAINDNEKEVTIPLETFNQNYTKYSLTTTLNNPTTPLTKEELQNKGQGGLGPLINYAWKLVSKLVGKPTKSVQKEAKKTLNKLKNALNGLKGKAKKTAGDIGKEIALQTAYDTLHGEYCKHFKC